MKEGTCDRTSGPIRTEPSDPQGPQGCAAPPVAAQPFNRQPFPLPWPTPTEELSLENIDEAMNYRPWDAAQCNAGDVVRETLTLAAKAILRHVPRSPRRTLALQHLISARMDVNAAITFRGKF